MKPVPGSEIVGYSKLGKHEHENKTGRIRVPFAEASSPLSESLEQATRIGRLVSARHSVQEVQSSIPMRDLYPCFDFFPFHEGFSTSEYP